ncbi:response regulator receiver domain [Coralliovum pocilloporae]|uniref:response regulator receiver domain n=1 Tax=Coralliovum pocilloporae TaxID=3066369 RepID=UPI003307257A
MSYSDLVREAFIDPIRSVLIIDDEYPTWNKILGDQGDNKQHAKWLTNKDRIRRMVQAFKNRKPNMIVDMHDGVSAQACNDDLKLVPTEENDQFEQLAAHLYHSDMLVLDYQLDGAEGGGDKAIEIARQMLENPHYNLIAVHTAIEDLAEPFEQMLIGLLHEEKSFPDPLVARGQRIYERLISSWKEEEDEDAIEDFNRELEQLIGIQQFLYCYKHSSSNKMDMGTINRSGLFSPFEVWAKSKGLSEENEPFHFAVFALKRWQDKLAPKFSRSPHDALDWCDQRHEDGVFWIRSDRGFIAFAKKSQADDLVKVLQDAIEQWKPTPSRLISTRLRAELDRQGVSVEDDLLSKRQVFRKFFEHLKEQKSEADKRATLSDQINRYHEGLLDRSNAPVVDFGMRLLAADQNGENLLSHYGVFSKEECEASECHYNSYISSKPATGTYLTSGHIFTITKKTNQPPEYWVCVSPACDMVPGQRKVGLEPGSADENGNTAKAFMAVRLEGGFGQEQLNADQVNSNEFVFLEDRGEILVRSIYGKLGEENADRAKQPHWRLFMAKNAGNFDQVDGKKVRTLELSWVSSTHRDLEIKSLQAEVKWQLRYEYALNLNQKLGSNLTRVGLEFISS